MQHTFAQIFFPFGQYHTKGLFVFLNATEPRCAVRHDAGNWTQSIATRRKTPNTAKVSLGKPMPNVGTPTQ